MTGRPIRFGILAAPDHATGLVDIALAAQEIGFSTIALNDHLSSTVAPLLGLQAIAAATSDIRLATAVLNQAAAEPARRTLGFSYFVVPYGSTPKQFAPIVERLTGT